MGIRLSKDLKSIVLNNASMKLIFGFEIFKSRFRFKHVGYKTFGSRIQDHYIDILKMYNVFKF